MIVVVEGISASGKTTWCRNHANGHVVAETFPSDRHDQPAEGRATAEYWTDWNKNRWKDALSVERATGCAVCDTDPLKLHYAWGLSQIGEGSETQWRFQLEATRNAMRDQQLGFADLYLVKEIEPSIASIQRDRDRTRTRSRFDVHLRLQMPLVAWYRTLQTVLGGRVLWDLPSKLPIGEIADNAFRYDLSKFDSFIASLPRRKERATTHGSRLS